MVIDIHHSSVLSAAFGIAHIDTGLKRTFEVIGYPKCRTSGIQNLGQNNDCQMNNLQLLYSSVAIMSRGM